MGQVGPGDMAGFLSLEERSELRNEDISDILT